MLLNTEHRRDLYSVTVGAQGVSLAAHVNDPDNEIRSKNNAIRELRTRLQRRRVASGSGVPTPVTSPP